MIVISLPDSISKLVSNVLVAHPKWQSNHSGITVVLKDIGKTCSAMIRESTMATQALPMSSSASSMSLLESIEVCPAIDDLVASFASTPDAFEEAPAAT